MAINSLLLMLAVASQIETPQLEPVNPPNAALRQGNGVQVENTWSGRFRDNSLREVAPDSGVIVDRETFSRIWRAWRSDEDPRINFNDSIVLVGTMDGPNRMFVQTTSDGRGNLRATFGGTGIGGPGFGYILAQLPRDGIRTVDGQRIPREPDGAGRPRESNPPRQPERFREIVRVAIQGRLETGIVAIGGETTGTVVRANDMSFELAFDEPVLSRQAERLSGRPVLVTGTLTAKEGVEIGRRWIIEVDWIGAADDRRR